MKLKISLNMLLAVPILCSNAIAAYPYKCPTEAGGTDKWNFVKCQCTSYAAYKITGDGLAAFSNSYKVPRWGDAGRWGGIAKSIGISVDMNPKVGDIAYWEPWHGGAKKYGHVAYVESVSSNKKLVSISEYNWGKGLENRPGKRTISATVPSGYIHFISNGPGGPTTPTDPPASGKLPDFITSKVVMAKENGTGERYTWKVNETPYVHDWIDNVGKADWEGKAKEIKVAFYLSKAGSTSSVRAGLENIKKEHLKVKQPPKHEKIAFNIPQWAAAGYIYPGQTYNLVVCADRPKDQNNGNGDVKEIHESNNCSTPAVFYVDYGPRRNVDLMTSNLMLAGGKTTLETGKSYGLQADLSNIGTESPWNGCRTSYEIKGPSTNDQWQQVVNVLSTVAKLAPNSTDVQIVDESQGLKAPSIAGEYKIRACADYEQSIPEIDETNNCTEITVTVTAPTPPPSTACTIINPMSGLPTTGSFDLSADSINFPDTIHQGDSMHPKARLCGVSGSSPTTRAIWAYANCDGTGFTPFDDDGDDGLSAGECVTEEVQTDEHKATMPPGRYVMYFIANGKTQKPESDHGNNVTAKVFVVE